MCNHYSLVKHVKGGYEKNENLLIDSVANLCLCVSGQQYTLKLGGPNNNADFHAWGLELFSSGVE